MNTHAFTMIHRHNWKAANGYKGTRSATAHKVCFSCAIPLLSTHTSLGAWILESTSFDDDTPQNNPGPVAYINGEAQYEVEGIVGHTRMADGSISYWVQWVGWQNATLEPGINFNNSPAAAQYWASQAGPM